MNLIPLDRLNEHYFETHPQSIEKLRRWCRERMLPAKKIGGEWFVDADAFQAQLAAQDLKARVSPQALAVLDKFKAQGRH